MKPKVLRQDEANSYLERVGMKVDDWNRIIWASSSTNQRNNRLSFRAPGDARQLLNISQYAADWLPRSDWKLVQLDNSNYFNPVQSEFIASLLFETDMPVNMNRAEYSSFLFEFGDDTALNNSTELLIANLVFLFLLFGCFVSIVASKGTVGQILGLSDGVIYLYSNDNNVSGADRLMEQFGQCINSPAGNYYFPEWVSAIGSGGDEG